MTNPQLELILRSPDSSHPALRRHRRLQRARWWFNQMRQVVECALDRSPARPGRPEQTHFVLGHQEL